MRTDRELLELAAKAVGYRKFQYCETSGSWQAIYVDDDGVGFWMPLTDDGDNRRLQIKLRLGLVPLDGGGWDCITWDHDEEITLATDIDPNRAIVRAAAEISAQAHPKQHTDGGAAYE
ncbi:hypothetical protein [Achromobacter denitrificans]|uniref:hypothetical protein n=1 Tax=Achromobacter denitrificans TaxID=32002 RepID=UPI003D01AE3E